MKKLFTILSLILLTGLSKGQIQIDTVLTIQGIGLPVPSGSVVTSRVEFKSWPIDSSGTAKTKHEVHFNLSLFLNKDQAETVGSKPLASWINEFNKGFVKDLTEAEYNSVFHSVTTGGSVDVGIIVMTWLKEMIEEKIGIGNSQLISLTPKL